MMVVVPRLSWGYERSVIKPTPKEIETEKLPRTAEEPESFWDFLKERTHVGYGIEEIYNDNLFLQDNNKRYELISTLEGEIFFADPRGAVLYGVDWEVNARHYHRNEKNGVDHDVNAFFDLDPGGRYRFRQDYRLDVNNSLTFGTEEIDFIRRSTDIHRSVKHTWTSKLQYALNETNSLVPQFVYSIFDDQVIDDADLDYRELKGIVDADHDLKPDWVVFTGYEFDKLDIPGDKVKSSMAHEARLGTRYELTDLAKLELLFKLVWREFHDKTRSTDPSFKGHWKYQAGPRTIFNLSYTDGNESSLAAGKRQFHSSSPAGDIVYELTPLTKLTLKANYEKQRTSAQDFLEESSATATRSSRYNLAAEILWQIREHVHAELSYGFSRSKTSDQTDRIFRFVFEAEL